MTTGETIPDLDTFRTLAADRRVVPVTRRYLADGETPIGLYRKLADDRPGTFLLESAEQGVWSRYSFVGVRSELALTEVDGAAHWIGDAPAGIPREGAPLDVLAAALEALRTPPDDGRADLPPLTGGFVGYLGYDTVRRLERIGNHAKDDLGLPELTLLLASDLGVLDHSDGSVTLIANAINHNGTPDGVDGAYRRAVARLDAMTAALARPVDQRPATIAPPHSAAATPVFTGNRTSEDYRAAVEAAKEEIRAGEAFQIVLSQRFEAPTRAGALDVYRVLRATNPSPYMYLFRFPGVGGASGFDIVGSSPEALVKVTDGEAMLHPIAGTRPRGATPEKDVALAAELLADPKERAEHLMLVDLGRNDIGRISAPGTVEVVDFMSVERYSHVMHIVSTVVGKVAPGRTALDVLLAAFPAGTLSGAPKPRAMQIIDELEPTRRGLYGGCVGYLDFAGNADTAIAIRTALLRDGIAYVQAGAGIVADSNPAAEDAECHNKAMAVLRAIAPADTLRPLYPTAVARRRVSPESAARRTPDPRPVHPLCEDGHMTATSTAPPATKPGRSGGTREKIVAALLAAAGAGLILASDGRGWASATVTAPIRLSVETSGSNLTSLPYALGLAGLAGALALFAVRRVGRYLVGLVLLGAGVGTIAAVASNLGRLDSTQLARTAEQTLGASAAQLGPVSNTAWPYVTLAGGLLVALAGGLTLARGHSWTGLSSRYDRNAAAAGPSAPATTHAAATDEPTARDLWDAINRGTDPTA